MARELLTKIHVQAVCSYCNSDLEIHYVDDSKRSDEDIYTLQVDPCRLCREEAESDAEDYGYEKGYNTRSDEVNKLISALEE